MALRTEQKLPIILSVVFVTLTTFGVLFYQSTESLKQARDQDRRSSLYISQVDQVYTHCLDSANAVRGFMFTGNDSYLTPYQRAKQSIPTLVAQLNQSSQGDAVLQENADRLAKAMGDFLAEMDRKVEQRKIIGFKDELLQEFYLPEDRTRMELITGLVRELKNTESARQRARDSRMDQGLSQTIWILLVSSVAGVAAIGLANFVVFREIKKRASAETALIDANRG